MPIHPTLEMWTFSHKWNRNVFLSLSMCIFVNYILIGIWVPNKGNESIVKFYTCFSTHTHTSTNQKQNSPIHIYLVSFPFSTTVFFFLHNKPDIFLKLTIKNPLPKTQSTWMNFNLKFRFSHSHSHTHIAYELEQWNTFL